MPFKYILIILTLLLLNTLSVANADNEISIVSATYGPKRFSRFARKHKDVTDILKNDCNGVETCTINVNNRKFEGDPCHHFKKWLIVNFYCCDKETGNRQEFHSLETREGQVAHLNCKNDMQNSLFQAITNEILERLGSNE